MCISLIGWFFKKISSPWISDASYNWLCLRFDEILFPFIRRQRLKGLGGGEGDCVKVTIPMPDYYSSWLFFWTLVHLLFPFWPFPGTLLLVLKWSIHFINFEYCQHINLWVQVKNWTSGHNQLSGCFPNDSICIERLNFIFSWVTA